jgi:hypothetical protein
METALRQLLAKFEAATAIFEKASVFSLCPTIIPTYATELASLQLRFALATSHLYLAAAAGESQRIAATDEFTRILAAEDYSGDIDRLVSRGEGALRSAGVSLREEADVPGGARSASRRGRGRGKGDTRGRASGLACLCARACSGGRGCRGTGAKVSSDVSAEMQRLLDVYPRGEAVRGEVCLAKGATQTVNYEQCPVCSHEMTIDTGRSVLRCTECGAIQELVGTVFDDAQFYSQEGQKAKSGTFNPNRHFQFWWTHILAREPEDEIGDKDDPDNQYGERILETLRSIVTRDNKLLRLTTVNDVRAMLREIGRTDLNKNVPLIMKKLTGIGPPQVPDSIAARVENLFTKAIEVGERIRRTGRVNRNYYPFYILKILAQVLPEDDYDNRRVLYYIYIQSRETVEADDADWEQVCLELSPELTYVPTDRTLGLKYGPAHTH